MVNKYNENEDPNDKYGFVKNGLAIGCDSIDQINAWLKVIIDKKPTDKEALIIQKNFLEKSLIKKLFLKKFNQKQKFYFIFNSKCSRHLHIEFKKN